MSQVTLMWFRRDLRLGDHPALTVACAEGRVIPMFICDETVETLGAAPKWRLGLSLAQLDQRLRDRGSRLVLRRGNALQVLREVIAETGATAVHWTRAYDPASVVRDIEIKAALKADGVAARSFGGHVMFEPWTVETKTGGFYRVYSPFWRAVKDREVEEALPEPGQIAGPEIWPRSDAIEAWNLGQDMRRGAEIAEPHQRVGEHAARDRLDEFIESIVQGYDDSRNRPDQDGTSGLSANLALGEISAHLCWHAGLRALHNGKRGAETYLKELVWREFAYHLTHHTPHMLRGNWKPDWDAFPWNTEITPEVEAWQRGRTGVLFVDAAMREMYVTGTMHNRGRMIVASYLTKHLMTHWRVGQAWFEECLTDWDPASNAMGWQWAAGSGPDAAPYFRVFNPVMQQAKFDPNNAYVDRWIAEGRRTPHADALSYFDAIPKKWSMSPRAPYPQAIVDVSEGRKRALSAYEGRSF